MMKQTIKCIDRKARIVFKLNKNKNNKNSQKIKKNLNKNYKNYKLLF